MRKYFITGSLIVLPVLITTILFLWLFRLLDGLLGRYINHYLLSHYNYAIPGLGIILALIIVLLVGFLGRLLISKKIISILEGWFVKFPIIKQIYPAAKQIIYFLFTEAKTSFRKTVLVEYPRKGIYSLGFLTNEDCACFNEKTNKELFGVFLPSTPSPLTGFLVFVPKEDMIVVDILVEDALKLIISGGVVGPASKVS
jgi:uncharacterized membrane protein